jgi:ribosomal protein S18 acetylase RimI-like enzyme
VVSDYPIRLALPTDAAVIAEMSRRYIEHGLGWAWTEARVLRSIRDRATNVAVTGRYGFPSAFGIMKYADETAHLCLLAVEPAQRRKGTGAALLRWLETVACTAGISRIAVEARADNETALAFYRQQGYFAKACIRGYYQGVEDGVRLEKALWPAAGPQNAVE